MDKTFTPQEMKKALECCINGKCVECPLKAMFCSDNVAMAYALELVNHYEAEIERLQKVQVDYVKAFLDEYVSRLKNDFALAMSDGNIPICEIIDELTDTMKSEYDLYNNFTDLIVEKAIKEFAERFKSFLNLDQSGEEETVSFEDIDNLVTEFLNESKVSE